MGSTTLVFTDIEDSTRLWERHPDTFLAALKEHDRFVTETLSAAGGKKIKNLGDGLFAQFSSPLAAFGFAVAVQAGVPGQSWSLLDRDDRIRVRIGIHYGDPHAVENDLLGLPVNRAARLCAAGHGGQTLVSEAMRRQIGDDLPSGVRIDHLGVFRLRGFSGCENVYQLSPAGKREAFPALRARSLALPPERTPFVGREEILSYSERLLTGDGVRLITFTGMGGMGKSRTALRLAHRLASAFEGGLYFVELAPLTNAGQVLPQILQTMGAAAAPDEDPIRSINTLVDEQPALLVLDNLEHLEGVEEVVCRIVDGCPAVRILATSRVVLRAWQQQEIELPPLAVPEPDDTLPSVRRARSVQLFVKRVQAFDRSFRLTEHNAAAVGDVCRISAGIPLAIELASQLVQVHDIEAVAARLQSKLLEIDARTPDLPARLRSLKTAFEYSYSLLQPDHRQLLSKLLVFRGGFTYSAVEAVCSGGLTDVEAIWENLVNHRWVQRRDGHGARRFWLLEPVADYLRERAPIAGDTLFEEHARFYLRLSRDIDSRFRGRDVVSAFQQLRDELANFRAALRWACNAGSHDIAAQMGANLSNVMLDAGLWEEFEAWVGLAIRSAEIVADGPLLSQLTTVNGLMAERRGGLKQALASFNLALEHAHGSDRDLLRAHINLARISQEMGDKLRCERHAEQVILLAPACEMEADAGMGYILLASSRELAGNIDDAERLWEIARSGFVKAGDQWSLAHWDRERGRTLERLGELTSAKRYYGSCLRRYANLGLHQQMSLALGRIAATAMRQNDFQLCSKTLVVAGAHSGGVYGEVNVLVEVAGEMRARVGEQVARRLLEEAAGTSLQEILDRPDLAPPDDSARAVVRENAAPHPARLTA